MRLKRLGTALGGIALLAGLLVVSATAAPAATTKVSNITKSQRIDHARLVGHTSIRTSATNLAEGVTRSGAPAAFTDDLALVRSLTTGQPSTTFTPKAAKAKAAPSGASVSVGSQSQVEGGAAQTTKGLNAHDLAVTHGFVVEPPDQGLCAGNGFVVEMVNLNLQVFDGDLNAVTGPMILETFFNEGLAFGFSGGDITVQGDPRCYYDANTQRWFLSQLVLDLSTNQGFFDLAVSTTASPMDAFNLYSLENTDNFNPGCPCFGDQPTLGANHDAIFITTNEFSINGPEFNGAVMYAIDKQALAEGANSANTVIDFIGLTFPTPEWTATKNCVSTHGLFCWASVRPTSSPTSGDRRFGGVEYFLSALDFANTHDNRIGVWAATNTSSISSESPDIGLSEVTLKSEAYVVPSFARQKAGPIPLGHSGRFNGGKPQPEGPIQTNEDQIQSAVYAAGLVWGGLTTSMPIVSKGRIGIAYFAVSPNLTASGLSATIAKQGYLVSPGNDVEFPSIAVDSQGQGLISFTLSGPRYFPTSAYATIDQSGAGKVKVAALGQSPQDGFSEYRDAGTPLYRPRWGDYSAAVPVGQTIYFAAEYIQFPNCSNAAYAVDPTCGGTRSRSANWGTAVNKVDLSDNGG